MLTKHPHADIHLFRGRKISEAKLEITSSGELYWIRWGTLIKDKKKLRGADKFIAKMTEDSKIMAKAKSQVQMAIDKMTGNLKHGTKAEKEFAKRNLPKFKRMLNAF